MKIKSGFVSNSSTCSFIIVGWPVVETDEEIAKVFGVEPDSYGEIYDELYGSGKYPVHNYSDQGNFIGVQLARWDESYELDIKMTIDELIEKLEAIKEIAKKLGVDTKTAKIYAGSFMC